ncbi:hypothetical protein [Streptomyces sp. NPDC000410]|uniref:hypothetical protein n=1 Tax=Streptomyces sp. NPDC000410 TaxID=3154254 RepID=UPI00331D7D8E
MSDGLRITWTLAGPGWADCVVETNDVRAELTASDISNAPEDLLTAVDRLVAGEPETRVQSSRQSRPPSGGFSIAKRTSSGCASWNCGTAATTTTPEPSCGPEC